MTPHVETLKLQSLPAYDFPEMYKVDYVVAYGRADDYQAIDKQVRRCLDENE